MRSAPAHRRTRHRIRRMGANGAARVASRGDSHIVRFRPSAVAQSGQIGQYTPHGEQPSSTPLNQPWIGAVPCPEMQGVEQQPQASPADSSRGQSTPPARKNTGERQFSISEAARKKPQRFRSSIMYFSALIQRSGKSRAARGGGVTVFEVTRNRAPTRDNPRSRVKRRHDRSDSPDIVVPPDNQGSGCQPHGDVSPPGAVVSNLPRPR